MKGDRWTTAAPPGRTMNFGLTGGIGCGKSTTLRMFSEEGVPVVDTDALVRDLLAADKALIDEVTRAFGADVLDAEGRIDRGALGRRVFRDPAALRRLEKLVHPRVRAIWMEAIKRKLPLLVVEIPLLFEKNLEGFFDWTLCVSCQPDLQEKRLRARGMNLKEIQLRRENQLSLPEKMKRADTVLHNDGEPEFLREQVRHLVSLARENRLLRP
jgi:dephospho-CoA kinase